MTDKFFQIDLQATGNHPAPPERRLAALLKAALRRFGFVCTGYRKVDSAPQPASLEPRRKDGSHAK
jgi:hypothetical protein